MGRDPVRTVVCGVSGCGKSTVGRALADRLGVAFLDGDDLHPPANIAKMRAGRPLDDDDRAPWLAAIHARIVASPGLVVACSALRRLYRDALRATGVRFVLLAAPRDVLLARLTARVGHFMPAGLLDSQLATLEPLQPDEPGITLDATRPVPELVAAACAPATRPPAPA